MSGPPNVRRPAPPQDRPTDDLTSVDHRTASEAARLWRRGRAELPCGHRGDPFAGCRRHVELSDVQAEGAVSAIEHLNAIGTPGLADSLTCRAMARVGRRDLAESVFRRTWGGQIA